MLSCNWSIVMLVLGPAILWGLCINVYLSVQGLCPYWIFDSLTQKGLINGNTRLWIVHFSKSISMLRIQVSVQILIPLIFYSSQFILLIFHSCMHLQSAGVCCDCCDCCDCIVSQECDSVTSALFQRLRYEFISSWLFFIVSYLDSLSGSY